MATEKRRGRPPLPEGERKTVMVAFWVSPDDHKMLVDAARRSGCSVATLVRSAVLDIAK